MARIARTDQADPERDEDWEVVPVTVAPGGPGMIVKVRFAPDVVDDILAAAEAAGLGPVEFARRAVLLVARDRALQEQLASSTSRADT
jgi:hypothetical protein